MVVNNLKSGGIRDHKLVLLLNCNCSNIENVDLHQYLLNLKIFQFYYTFIYILIFVKNHALKISNSCNNMNEYM